MPVGIAVALLAMGGSSAFAADVRPITPVVPVVPLVAPVPFNWTSHYAGLHCGVAWGRTVSTNGDESVTVEPLGGLCGGQVGANWQRGSLVFGVESDLGQIFMKGTEIFDAGGMGFEQFVAKAEVGTYATFTGRIGVAFEFRPLSEHKFLYFKAGAAVAHIKNTWIEYAGGPPADEFSEVSGFRWGSAIGGGLETALNQGWSWKMEYLALNFADVSASTSSASLTHENLVHTAKLGLNWRF